MDGPDDYLLAKADTLESRVMDLWDEGNSVQDIARALAISAAQASRVIAYMGTTASDLRSSPSAICNQSRALLAAIRTHHPDRVTA